MGKLQIPDEMAKTWRLNSLIEQGVSADGCALVTCGPTTGHFFKPIAFCDSPETAHAIATLLTERSKATGGEGA